MNTLIVEEKNEFILVVTLNRPEIKNAINSVMMQDLKNVFGNLCQYPTHLKCVILTANGDAFCAGADLKERKEISLEDWQSQHVWLQGAMRYLVDCPIPVISAVNGAAIGGGLELVLASDFAYAASNAVFSQPEVKVGLMPGAMGTQTLARATGLRRAKELAFTGDKFGTEEALNWGVINKICAPEKLMEEVMFTANKICENAPFAIREIKRAINKSHEFDIKSGYDFELEAYKRVLATKDRAEGILAFNEKRKPQFSGK